MKDISNVRCFKCGEKGHYASFHNKDCDPNPRIRAAHTTIGDDIRDDDLDHDEDAQSMREQLSDDGEPYTDHDEWCEVKFEEYPPYDSDDEHTEFMGMMHTDTTHKPEYDTSSK